MTEQKPAKPPNAPVTNFGTGAVALKSFFCLKQGNKVKSLDTKTVFSISKIKLDFILLTPLPDHCLRSFFLLQSKLFCDRNFLLEIMSTKFEKHNTMSCI